MQPRKLGQEDPMVHQLAAPQGEHPGSRSASDPLFGSLYVKKRNRISFVCQACRKSKTKCDREKPICGRCAQHGIPCIYDVEKQAAPKNPSKDAKIARLEKDLDYWKEKAMNLSQNQPTAPINPLKRPAPEKCSEAQKLKKLSNYEVDATGELNDLDDIQMNIYKDHPSMIMNRIMKREVKPLAENYAITQDKFLSGLVASVFLEGSKNTMIPALTASANISRALPSVRDNVFKLKEILIRQCQSESQKSRINDFTERILQNADSNKSFPLGMLPASIQGAFDRCSLEDFCPKNGEYSDILNSFIEKIQALLPPIDVTNKYKAHFYECVFPNLPFLNVTAFEESLSQTLFPDNDDPSKVKINLGNSRLRSKMENLCILLVILKLSYISLRFFEESVPINGSKIERETILKYPIDNGCIVIAKNCLMAENLYCCANENILTCLLYIWSFFVYSPEEGDFFLEHPTDVLSGLIVMLATSIGLNRDPSEYPQLQEFARSEPGILNHRRMLWLAITTAVSFESCLKGRYPLSFDVSMDQYINLRDPTALDLYLERVKADMNSWDPEFLVFNEMAFKRAYLGLLISDLDRMTLSYRTSFSLKAFEGLRDKINRYAQENYLPKVLEGISQENIIENNSGNVVTNGASALDFVALHSLIISKLILLRSSMAVFYHFEARLSEEQGLIQYYKAYFIATCKDSIILVNYIVHHFSDVSRNTTIPANNYNTTKAAQISLPSTFFGLLGMLMRTELARTMLFSEYHVHPAKVTGEKLREYNRKMEFLSSLKKDLEVTVEAIYNVASKHLRFTYFSVFKMLALFDVIIQRMRKGELWSGILLLQRVKEMNANSVRGLGMTLSLDLENDVNIVDQLKMKNFLGNFPSEELGDIYQQIKSAVQSDPLIDLNKTTNSKDNLNNDNAFSVPINSSMDNLDKLTSVATMSNNLEFHSSLADSTKSLNVRSETDFAPEVGLDMRQDTGNGLPIEFPGLFGGLDLFDYDFLFSNEL